MFWLSNPIFRFLRSNTLISKFSCSNVCKTFCLRWHSRAVGNNPFQSCSIDWDRGTNRWNFLLSWLSWWMLTMDHKQVNVKWPMNALIPVSLGYAFEDFFRLFFQRTCYIGTGNSIKFSYTFVFSEFQALVFGGIYDLYMFIELNLWHKLGGKTTTDPGC